MSITRKVQQQHSAAWRSIVEHRFLNDIGGGAGIERGFARWLEQDYHFVAGLIPFVGELIGRLDGRSALTAEIAGAIPVLQSELALFEKEAGAFGADVLRSTASPVCFNYLNYLHRLSSKEHPAVALLAYWTLEQAYFDGWSHVRECGSSDPRLADFIANWTCPEFGAYVDYLRQSVDDLMPESQFEMASSTFLQTVRFEFLFWNLGLQDDNWPL